MCAQVVIAVFMSSSLSADVRVKQGCVLAPINFDQVIVAMTLVSQRDIHRSDCAGDEYRLDGDLFKLRCVQAKTNQINFIFRSKCEQNNQ